MFPQKAEQALCTDRKWTDTQLPKERRDLRPSQWWHEQALSSRVGLVRVEGGSLGSCSTQEKAWDIPFPSARLGSSPCCSPGRAEAWLQQQSKETLTCSLARHGNEVRLTLRQGHLQVAAGPLVSPLNKMKGSLFFQALLNNKTVSSSRSSLQKHSQISLLDPGRRAAACFMGDQGL